MLRNVAQVAEEAAAQFRMKPEAARRRITRSEWFHDLAPAVAIPKHEPAPPSRLDRCQCSASAVPLVKREPSPKLLSLRDAIKQHIKLEGPRTVPEFAEELGRSLLEVATAVADPDHFEPLPGDRYNLR